MLIAQKIKRRIERLESPHVIELFRTMMDKIRTVTKIKSYTVDTRGRSMELELESGNRIIVRLEKKAAGMYGFESITVY